MSEEPQLNDDGEDKKGSSTPSSGTTAVFEFGRGDAPSSSTTAPIFSFGGGRTENGGGDAPFVVGTAKFPANTSTTPRLAFASGVGGGVRHGRRKVQEHLPFLFLPTSGATSPHTLPTTSTTTSPALTEWSQNSRRGALKNRFSLHGAVADGSFYRAGVLDGILEANPASVLELDHEGRTPLHTLLIPSGMELRLSANQRSVSLTLLRNSKTLMISPASIQDSEGRTPLHVACHYGLVEEIKLLEALLEAYPEALVTLDKDGESPLHVAFTGLAASRRIEEAETTYSAISLSLVQTLAGAHPKAAVVKTEHGQRTALHLAAVEAAHCQEGVFEAVLAANPHALLQPDAAGSTPLHLLTAWPSDPRVFHLESRGEELPMARRKRIVELIQLSLRVHPQAAGRADRSGRLPIHLALRYARGEGNSKTSGTTTQIVRVLLQANPDAATTDEHPVKTLLHLAANNSRSLEVEVFDMMQRANPSSVLHPDDSGLTPLHRLFVDSCPTIDDDDEEYNERCLQQVSVLLREVHVTLKADANSSVAVRAGPQGTMTTKAEDQRDAKVSATMTAAAAKDRNGYTPLHRVFLRKGGPLKIVQALLEACPAAARARDLQGRLPLHVAMSAVRLQKPAQLKPLLDAYPEAISQTDSHGQTPLHVLSVEPFDNGKIFDFLFEAAPEMALRQDRYGRTPLHNVLRWYSSPMENVETLTLVVTAIMIKLPNVAVLKDNDGVSPLQVAVEDVNRRRDLILKVLIAYPEAAGDTCWDGASTPLSTVLRHKDDKLMELLLEYCPGAARTMLANNTTMLHRVRTVAALHAVFDAWPEAILQRTSSNSSTAIHAWILDDMISDTTMVAFLEHTLERECTKEAIQLTDNSGYTPLHYIVAKYCELGMLIPRTIQRCVGSAPFLSLARAFPNALFMSIADKDILEQEGAYIHNTSGASIIEVICNFSYPNPMGSLHRLFEEILQPTDNQPSGLSSGEEEGANMTGKEAEEEDLVATFVLHKACEHSHEPGFTLVIDMCHNRYSKAVQTPENAPEMRLPLHIACSQSHCCLALVQRLTDLYGVALTTHDKNGQVPFMIGCLHNASLSVLYHLLRSSPDVLLGMSPRWDFLVKGVCVRVRSEAREGEICEVTSDGKGVVRLTDGDKSTMTVEPIDLERVHPKQGDKVLITGGDKVGLEGELVCIDGAVAVVQDSREDFHVVENFWHLLSKLQRLNDLDDVARSVEDTFGQSPFVVGCLHNASLSVLYHLLRSSPEVLYI